MFNFGYESEAIRYDIDGSRIPQCALVSFFQRGVMYVELEESVLDAEYCNLATVAMDGVTPLIDVHKFLCWKDIKVRRSQTNMLRPMEVNL